MEKNKTDRGREHLLKCKAAEWAVASQLAMRGRVPMFPAVDLGYDLLLDNGLRLQVKCSSLRRNNQGMKEISHNLGYLFDLRRGAWFSTEKRFRKTGLRPYSEVADYFVLWGIEENRFFIVPTTPNRAAIWFNSKIATSRSHNRNKFDKNTEDRLREFEDRWDLLDVASTSNELIESAAVDNGVAQEEKP